MSDPGTTIPTVEGLDGKGALRIAKDLAAEGRAAEARRWLHHVVDRSDDLATWSGAAKLLPRLLEAAPLSRSARVAVLGSSTTAQLATLLPLACARTGLHVEVYEAPYGQYRQEVLDPASALYAFDPDVVVLALHDGDVPLPLVSDDPATALADAARPIERLWELLGQRTRATVVQLNFAVPPEQPLGHLGPSVPGSRQRLLLELNLHLPAVAPPHVCFVDCAGLAASVGTRTWFDPRYWHLAKQAVAPRCLPLLSRHVGAVIGAALGLSRKALVLDLDNTLWGGVLGEDGLDGIRLGEGAEGEAFVAFQRYVTELQAKGVVAAICSKNDEHLVRDAFARHPAMVLDLEEVAVVAAGWDDKPAQLRRIASDLSLGLDALVFVDDNPVEREAVRQLVPEVDVIDLPSDPAGYVRALADYPYFATTRLTDEDRARGRQYRARAEAASALAEASSLEEFLDSLEMVATVEPVGPANLARVAQLVGKTNQFNLTSIRRTETELADLVAQPGVLAKAFRLRDRFDDHGLVGVLITRPVDDALEIDTWLMSCRVIGRTLEHAMLSRLARRAVDGGYTAINGTYSPTPKNGLVADLYPRLGFEPVGPPADDGTTRWRLAPSALSVRTHVRLDQLAADTGKAPA